MDFDTNKDPVTGPLVGLRVLEFSGLGPGPFAAMYLADLGADVISLKRRGAFQMPGDPSRDVLERGKRPLEIDLKSEAGKRASHALAKQADVVIEGYRPGVMERLGLGPEDLHKENPRLIYGRMTGWGQTGPLAQRAGHDPNYIGLIGALHAIGHKGERPVMPLSLVGDFGGGAMYLVAGILSALWNVSRGGQGQVIDAAIVDGAAHLMAPIYSFKANGQWVDERGSNLMDSGTPFCDTYETADGKYLSVAAMEEPLYQEFIHVLGIAKSMPERRFDPSTFDEQRRIISSTLRTRTRDEWVVAFEGKDACVGPILSLTEAPLHPHNLSRSAFFDRDGHPEPSPAPRFSRTPTGVPEAPKVASQLDPEEVMASWGVERLPVE